MDEQMEKLGYLISKSNMDLGLKDKLLDNLSKMPRSHINEIIEILENEERIMEELEIEMLRFIKRQDEVWQEAIEKQKQSVQEVLSDTLKRITPRNLSVNQG